MSLKNFFIASLALHVVGAVALYFYYNPITFAPKPVGQFEEDQAVKEKLEEKNDRDSSFTDASQQKTAQPHRKPKLKKFFKQKPFKKILKAVEKPKQKDSQPVKKAVTLDPASEQALSEAKDPAPTIKEAPKETENSSDDLELKEITEPVGAADQATAPNKSPAPIKTAEVNPQMEETKEETTTPTPVKTVETNPIDIEQMEEIEEGITIQNKPVETAEANPIDIEQMEEIEEETTAQGKPPKPVKTATAKPAPALETNNPNKTNFKLFQSLKQKRGNNPLIYPGFARRGGMEGTVSVAFFVSEQGLVDQIQLLSSSGHAELDNYVLRELARYEFLPGQESWVQHQIPFKLEGEEKEYEKLRTKE